MQHGWWGKAVGVACAGALAFGGVAVAAPNGDPGPPEQAQGNGPPATPPGQAKKEQAPAATTQAGGDTHGKSTGGPAKAHGNGHTGGGGGGAAGGPSPAGPQGPGNGHTGGSGQATAGGQSSSGSNGQARGRVRVGNSNSQEGSGNGHAGKTTLCHATGSETNPYVEITISDNGVPAHDRHQNDEDIIPADGDCPGGASGGKEHGKENEHGKVTICHATGSETNPFVRITVSVNALPAHTRHQNEEDIVNPQGDCPSSAVPAGVGNPPSGIVSGNTQLAGAPESGAGEAPASGVMGVSEESGTSPAADEGGVLGAQAEGGVEGATQIASTSGGSLPFTGLAIGLLVALGALLALTGLVLHRRMAE